MRIMIHMHCKNRKLFLTALLAIGLLLPGSMLTDARVYGQTLTEKRSVSRSYTVSPETSLEVHNKYGKIQLNTWDKDEVSIEVEILLSESSKSRLKKLKEDISIDFYDSKEMVRARTMIESESGRLASEIKSIGSTISGSNKKVEINYLIHLPAYINVQLTNKFGDIYMDDLNGEIQIILSNGVLKANHLEGNSDISLSFANGMIKSLGTGKLSLSYSDLVLDEATQLELTSKSSKLNADSVDILNINSRRDKLYFKHVEYLSGTGNFSQLWIYDFLRESDLYMKYGKLTIEHIVQDFEKIQVEAENADLILHFDREAVFEYEVMYAGKAEFRIPATEPKPLESYTVKDYITAKGSIGTGKASGFVHIDAHQKSYINIAYK